MGPGTKKYVVKLLIEVSDSCIKRVDNGVADPEEFVKVELGWARESFDGMVLTQLTELPNKEDAPGAIPAPAPDKAGRAGT